MVESHEPPAVRNGKREQVNVRDLLVPLQLAPVEHRRVRDGNIIRPERMVAALLGGIQSAEHEGGGLGSGVARISHHAQARVLGQRASGPTCGVIGQEPAGGFCMSDVFWVEERHQKTYVK